LTETRCIRNLTDVSSETFDGEVVLVNFATGRYFSLAGSGPAFWRRLEAPASVAELAAAVAAAHGVEPEAVLPDAAALVQRLREEGLVVDSGDAPAEPATPVSPQPAGGPYAAPRLDVFSELEELIALDPVHDVDVEAGWPLRPADGA